ncbi:MAG TPA: cytochrome c oxidase subunit II [Candidatus Limnocylindrales bacterium]|nr:cytochrome c oxidase subunit II [Candidatus Limnocylindrales bacterium]
MRMLNWLPEDVSTYGKEVDSLFYLIYYITGIVFLLVTVAMIVFLIKYRYQEGRRAIYTHGSTTLEIIWTAIPAIILILLAFKSQAAWSHIKMNIPPGEVQIRVLAKQFNWDITYPGPDGKFGTEDDLPRPGDPAILDEIHVPVNKVVRVELVGKDVIHSFFLPHLRLKQDVLPGRTILAWFQATKPGRYPLPCAELCGIGHSGMLGSLIVHTPEEYAAWVKEKWPSTEKAQ